MQKISVAGLVLRKQHEPCRMVVDAMLFVVSCAPRDKKIDADDGFDIRRLALFVKFYRAVQIAVVGERKRCLAVLFGRGDEVGDLGQRFEQ